MSLVDVVDELDVPFPAIGAGLDVYEVERALGQKRSSDF